MWIIEWLKFIVHIFSIILWRFLGSIFTLEIFSRGATVYRMKHRVDESEASIIHKPGTSTIQGQTYIQLKDGTHWTSPGHYSVWLIPFTHYAQERLNVLYANDQGGFDKFNGRNAYVVFDQEDSCYKDYMRKACVDPEGNFEFKNISAGTYYLLSEIRHKVDPRKNSCLEGGNIMRKLTIAEHETQKVLMIENYV